jgi:hypothetical protein
MFGNDLALRSSYARSCTDSLLTAKMLSKIYVILLSFDLPIFCFEKQISEILEILLMIS